MNKKAFLGTLMSIVLITVAAVVFYIFFYQFYSYDKGVTFEKLGYGEYVEYIDDLDLTLISFLRTNVDGFSISDHVRLGNENVVRPKANEAFEILCQGNAKCYWSFDAQSFGIDIEGGNTIQQGYGNSKEAWVNLPVDENPSNDKKIRLLVYYD